LSQDFEEHKDVFHNLEADLSGCQAAMPCLQLYTFSRCGCWGKEAWCYWSRSDGEYTDAPV